MAGDAAAALAETRDALADAGLPAAGLPEEIRVAEHVAEPGSALVRTQRDGDPQPVTRPAAAQADVIPVDLDAAQELARAAAAGAGERLGLAQRRLDEAQRLEQAERQVLRVEAEAGQLRDAAEEDAATADGHAVNGTPPPSPWPRAGAPGAVTRRPPNCWARPTGPRIRGSARSSGTPKRWPATTRPALDGLDEVADVAARPARAAVTTARAELDRAASDDRAGEAALRAERADLAAERDPKPDEPTWLDAGGPGNRCGGAWTSPGTSTTGSGPAWKARCWPRACSARSSSPTGRCWPPTVNCSSAPARPGRNDP